MNRATAACNWTFLGKQGILKVSFVFSVLQMFGRGLWLNLLSIGSKFFEKLVNIKLDHLTKCS